MLEPIPRDTTADLRTLAKEIAGPDPTLEYKKTGPGSDRKIRTGTI